MPVPCPEHGLSVKVLMKTIRIIPIIAPGLLALALLAVPASARAEDPQKDKPLTKNQQKYDADKDGQLNDEEKAAAKAAAAAKAKHTREENLAKYDANQDGKLDDEEKARKSADEQAAKAAAKAEREAKKVAQEEAKR